MGCTIVSGNKPSSVALHQNQVKVCKTRTTSLVIYRRQYLHYLIDQLTFPFRNNQALFFFGGGGGGGGMGRFFGNNFFRMRNHIHMYSTLQRMFIRNGLTNK